jgi:hypothetical protein
LCAAFGVSSRLGRFAAQLSNPIYGIWLDDVTGCHGTMQWNLGTSADALAQVSADEAKTVT